MTSKSPLLAVLPEGTVVTAAIERAVEGFESRHTNRIVVAQEQIVQNVGDLLRRSRFESAVADVRRNRWMVPKRYDPVTSVVKDAPLQFDPRGSDSVWRDRAAWCDSKAYEDSDAVERARLDRCLRLASRASLGVKTSASSFEANHQLFFNLFSHYACMPQPDMRGAPRLSLSYLTQPGWIEFLDEYQLVDDSSSHCKRAQLEALFHSIDKLSEKAKVDYHRGQLSFAEFAMALTTLSNNKYKRAGTAATDAEAVAKLFAHLRSIAPPGMVNPPNHFRRMHCYTYEVSAVLKPHEPGLRRLFHCLAAASETQKGSPLQLPDVRGRVPPLLDTRLWLRFLQAVNLLGSDVTEKSALLAFAWSRMAVINNATAVGEQMEGHITFEGFVEALCRISAMKALPTDDEVSDYGSPNAGVYLEAIKQSDPRHYDRLVRIRSNPWGEEPKAQPVHRCVAHVIVSLLYTVNNEASAGSCPGLGIDAWVANEVVSSRQGGGSAASSPERLRRQGTRTLAEATEEPKPEGESSAEKAAELDTE